MTLSSGCKWDLQMVADQRVGTMRGYFGLGVEGVSKGANIGAVFRTAHAFGAGFVFTVDPRTDVSEYRRADTSNTAETLPFYVFDTAEDLVLPQGCKLVGIELLEDSVDLPSFRHPRNAAYILGSERGGLSKGIVDRCDHVVKIPMRFSLNLSVAGALVMYDRMLTLGRFPPRPVRSGGPTEDLPDHVHGNPVLRKRAAESL